MAKLYEELSTDFSAGMFDSAATTRYPSASCRQIQNGRILADGTVRRRSGWQRTHTNAINTGTCNAATHFVNAAGADQLVTIINTKAYTSADNGVNWTERATGLTDAYYDLAHMRVGANQFLFAANGAAAVQRWDGTTWDTLPNIPANVKYLAVFNGRLYATGHSGRTVVASKIADPTTWTTPDGLSLQVYAHEGDEITGLYQVGPHLLVFDRRQTSYIDGFGEQDIIVASGATGLSPSVGCVAFRSIVPVGDNAICWLSERGIEYYTPGQGIQLVSKPIQKLMESLNWTRIHNNPGQVTAAYDDRSQDYIISLPGANPTAGTRNNVTIVCNLRRGDIEYERGGPRAAFSQDYLMSTSYNLLFGEGADKYLVALAGGYPFKDDGNEYITLDVTGVGAEYTVEDGDGYLDTAVDETSMCTIYQSYSPTHDLFYVGFDGFHRKYTGTKDDLLAAGTGGTSVTMTLITKPFLFKNPSQSKRTRAVHVGAIGDTSSTVRVAVRSEATSTAERSITVPAGTNDQVQRKTIHMNARGDSPQVEVRTEDAVRLSLVGVSAALLRDTV